LQRQEGAPEHASKMIDGQVASFCTMNNVQYYSLSPPPRSKEPVYAIVVISNVSIHNGKLMYMIDKVEKVDDKGELANVISYFKKLSYWLKNEDADENEQVNRSRTFSASSMCTPYTTRKSRRLSEHPTGDSLRTEEGGASEN